MGAKLGNQTAAGVVIFVATLGALVTLELTGNKTETVMLLAGPVVAALLVNGHLSTKTDEQNVKLDKITAQTNGVLDGRIKTQTLAALAEAGVVQAPHALEAPKLSPSSGEHGLSEPVVLEGDVPAGRHRRGVPEESLDRQ